MCVRARLDFTESLTGYKSIMILQRFIYIGIYVIEDYIYTYM